MFSVTFRTRFTGILLMVAGYGWAGGHFIPADSPFWAYLFQLGILLLLLIFSLAFVKRSADGVGGRGWASIALTIFAALSLAINIGNIVRGYYSSDTHGYGSHNTLPDLVPIGILVVGDLLWLGGSFGAGRRA